MNRRQTPYLWRLLSLVLAVAVIAGNIGLPVSAASSDSAETMWKALLETKYTPDSYHSSLSAHPQAVVREDGPLIAGGSALPESQNVRTEVIDSEESAAHIGAQGKAVFAVEIPADGFYQLRIRYAYDEKENLKNSDLSIDIDDEPPFYQAHQLSLPRIWTQEALEHTPDSNDRQPNSLQLTENASYIPMDDTGMAGAYLFYFSQGTHRLRLSSQAGGFSVLSIQVGVSAKTGLENHNYSYTRESITIEAEDIYRKNDSSISGGFDRTDAGTSPNDPVYKKINILSGSRFSDPGQYVTWKFRVEKAGWYRLNFRYMQENLPGLFVSRNLYIDDQPIVAGDDALRFPYSEKWQIATATDAEGEPIAVDLEAGEHTLTLEVTLSVLQSYTQRLDDVIFLLNALYRKMIMITGTTPDLYRDYDLEAEIPYLIPCFAALKEEIESISAGLKELGAEGGVLSVLGQTAEQLQDFCDDSYRMQDRLSWYVSNISSVSSLLMGMQEGPLNLDWIRLESSEEVSIKGKTGFWESLLFHIRAFIGSFFCDYSAFGDVLAGDREEIVAWFSGSREQSELLQDIVNEQFGAAEPSVSVKLKLVGIPLTQAVLAGTAPDVCLSVGRNQPVNLGARGVLEDLTGYEGFSALREELSDNLIRPYCYKNAVYGIPITLDYHVLFYRSDILQEIGATVPEDWEQFYKLIPVLQKNNLCIGLPYALMGASEGSLGVKDIFATLLLQRDAKLYADDLSAVRLDDRQVAEAFREWTEFYTKYQFSLDYNLFNRFRTGEMPLAIASYATYNQLAEAAPEIKGMWGMAPIPGLRRQDGSIDRTQAASGSAAILIKNSTHKETAWKFLRWWASAEAQGAYGNALEVLMGEVARYTPAHPQAVALLPWSEQDLGVLMEQRASITELPEVLGGYYVVRSIDNAFRSVLYNGANYKEALLTQQVIINTELERKQREFAD